MGLNAEESGSLQYLKVTNGKLCRGKEVVGSSVDGVLEDVRLVHDEGNPAYGVEPKEDITFGIVDGSEKFIVSINANSWAGTGAARVVGMLNKGDNIKLGVFSGKKAKVSFVNICMKNEDGQWKALKSATEDNGKMSEEAVAKAVKGSGAFTDHLLAKKDAESDIRFDVLKELDDAMEVTGCDKKTMKKFLKIASGQTDPNEASVEELQETIRLIKD